MTLLSTRALLLSLAGLLAPADAHGALSFPRPRSAIDGQLPAWQRWRYPCDATHKGKDCDLTFCENGKDCQGSCPISAHSGVVGDLNASNGQACYWFSNGCTIGCDRCDGTQNHVGHGLQRFLYKGMSLGTMHRNNVSIDRPFWPEPGDMVLNTTTAKTLNVSSNCAHRTTNATICDPALRTANSQAECGSPEDFYYFSPWRAPGSAPVIDACGSAGGRWPGQGTGGAGAQYENTSLARQGDAGGRAGGGRVDGDGQSWRWLRVPAGACRRAAD
jgi:hypothetical protein